MALDLPTEGNVTGGVGGGTQIYLRCVSFCVSSKKNDGTSFTADDFTIEVDCPKMSCKTLMGAAYEKDGKTYYPTYLYANGNGCLYNIYAIPSDKTVYAMSQKINQTYAASAAPQEASMTISPGGQADGHGSEGRNVPDLLPEGLLQRRCDRADRSMDGKRRNQDGCFLSVQKQQQLFLASDAGGQDHEGRLAEQIHRGYGADGRFQHGIRAAQLQTRGPRRG